MNAFIKSTGAVAIALAGALAGMASSPALAGPTYLSKICGGSERYGDETTCTERGLRSQANVEFTFNAEGPPTLYLLRITAPREHCSPVQYLVYQREPSGGFALTDVTRFLRAGESEDSYIHGVLPRGPQVILIGAIGRVEGCNVGAMQSWGVFVEPVIVPN